MKTLREVIKELQEFGERENVLDLPCIITRTIEYDACDICMDMFPSCDEIDELINMDIQENIEFMGEYKGKIVVL
jgi:hypothetical protein